jgi:hypothetical protein
MVPLRKFTLSPYIPQRKTLVRIIAAAIILGLSVWMILAAHLAGAAGVVPTVRGSASATHRYTVDPKMVSVPFTLEGDLMIMIFVTDNGSVTDMQLPAGFVERSRREFGINSNHMIIATKIASASEPGNYTYIAPSGADTRVDLISVADADPNSLPVIVTSETAVSATTHAAPSVAPAGINDLLISGVTLMSNPTTPGATTWTPPTGMTEVTDAQTSTILTLTTARQALTGGPSGTKTFTATAGTAVKGMAFSIAINGVDDEPNAVPPATSPSVRDVVVEMDPWTDEAMTVARPTVVEGDLLVMNFLADWGAIDEMIVPTGFKIQYRLDRGVDKNHMVVATKVATGSEPSSYSYSANTAADTRVDLFSIKDADTLAPLVGAGVTTSTSVNYLTAPSLAPLGTNDLLLSSANFVHYPDPGIITWTAPFGMTEKSDARTANLSMTSAVEPLTAGGQTGARTFLGAPQTPQPGDAFSVAIKGIAGNTVQLVPNGMTGGWTSGTYTDIDEGENVTSDYLRASGTTTTTATFSMATAANITSATSITLHVCAYSATNANGGSLDTVTNNIAGVGGTPASFVTTPPYSAAGTCKWEQQTYYGTWTQAQIDALQLTFARTLAGTGSNAAKADDVRLVSAYATVVYSTPPVVSQAAYRWFANGTGGALGAPLAATNTMATAPALGQAARLRVNAGVATGDLDAGTSYKLRYVLKSGGSCSTNPVLYSDVTTSTPIKFHDETALVDSALYASSANDPTRSGIVPVSQTYRESNPLTVVTPVLKNQDGLWDIALARNSGAAPGVYCFMLTKTDNSGLASYTALPEIEIPPVPPDQSSYRFFKNLDSTSVGVRIGTAQNTPVALEVGQPFRLRQILLPTVEAVTTLQTFKLQIAEKITSCSAATYADATMFMDNPSVSDEASVSQTTDNPTPVPSGSTLWTERYSENATTTVSRALALGESGIWDFALTSDASFTNKTYCFRMAKGDGSALNAYTFYPEATFLASGVEQSSYLFHRNINSINPGVSFATQNTPVTIGAGQPYRLKQNLKQLFGSTTTSETFKVQTAEKITTCDVATYADATLFTDNPSVSDEATINAYGSPYPPTGGTVVSQSYTEDAGFTVKTAVPADQSAVWDISLKSELSYEGKTYCFRTVYSDGRLLGGYAFYPEVTFTLPTLEQRMRGGQSVTPSGEYPLNW